MATKFRNRTMGLAERGVTLIEMMIAITVLSIGLVTLAQLFVAATMNNDFAITTSGGVNDAQWLIESWKASAATTGVIGNTTITSSIWGAGNTQFSAAFNALPGYVSANSRYRENVWVYDFTGTLVGSASPALPPGVGSLQAKSIRSRIVYIQLVPKVDDPRTNMTLVVSTMITGNDQINN